MAFADHGKHSDPDASKFASSMLMDRIAAFDALTGAKRTTKERAVWIGSELAILKRGRAQRPDTTMDGDAVDASEEQS